MTVSLWILNAGISATLAVWAYDQYQASRDPNTWLRLESRPVSVSRVLVLADDGYYLLDLTLDSDLKPKKMDSDEGRAVAQRLERQATLHDQNEFQFNYVILSKLTNVGTRPLPIRLPLRVSYEGVWRKDLTVPRPRDIQIPIQPLNPGESFKVIIFSIDPNRYSSFDFPDSVPVQWDKTGQVRRLKVNLPGRSDRRLGSALCCGPWGGSSIDCFADPGALASPSLTRNNDDRETTVELHALPEVLGILIPRDYTGVRWLFLAITRIGIHAGHETITAAIET